MTVRALTMLASDWKPWFAQLLRYGVVGLLNNLRGYLIYLLITWFWLDPKTAVAIMYPIGATLAYFGHSRFTFAFEDRYTARSIGRYSVAHLIGYGMNLGLLYLFHDRMGFPHQMVQVGAIFGVAGVLFILFKYYVFAEQDRSVRGS